MVHITIAMLVALAIPAFSADLPTPYTLMEQRNFKSYTESASTDANIVANKENISENERPVYNGDIPKNQGRARIEPVRPTGPIIKYDRMLSDQPASTEINKIDAPNYGYAPGPSEVLYPDIPYAPGYGYETGYPDTDRYAIYNNDFLEPDTSTMGLIWSQVPDSRTLVSYAGRTISWIFSSIFVLFIGSLLTVGVCTYTSLCTINFQGVGPIHEEMRALMSPERLENISTAAGFVRNAIDKYQKIQKITELASENTKKKRQVFTK